MAQSRALASEGRLASVWIQTQISLQNQPEVAGLMHHVQSVDDHIELLHGKTEEGPFHALPLILVKTRKRTISNGVQKKILYRTSGRIAR